MSSVGITPEHRHMRAVAEQMRMVSMKTDSICTRPCLAGWETSAVAAALGAEPIPASLEYRPRLMPCIMQEPAKPPKIAEKSKALTKMFLNTVGTRFRCISTTTRAMAT